MRNLLTLTLLMLLLAACATPAPTPGAFESAERRLQAAVDAGAEQHSPVELRFAREKLAEARESAGAGYGGGQKALYLIEQSEINSELAIEKSRTAEARARVAEQARQNEILREDFEASFGEGVQ